MLELSSALSEKKLSWKHDCQERTRAWNFERHTLWIWCCRNTWKTCQMLRTCHKQFKKKVQLHHNAYWNKSLVNNNNLHPPAPMWNLFHEENEHKNTNTVWLLPARRNASWQQQCKLSKPWHGPLHTYLDRNENFEYYQRAVCDQTIGQTGYYNRYQMKDIDIIFPLILRAFQV